MCVEQLRIRITQSVMLLEGTEGRSGRDVKRNRKREHYEKPSVKRKKKSEAARKRKYN